MGMADRDLGGQVGSICDVGALRVGHDTDGVGVTGCTVVLCEGGAVAGVDVRGGAPGTRETDLLRPENTVERVHAVLLTGGSAYGLDAAGGVMRYLEERGVGFPVGPALVPIVVGAVLFDLSIGDGRARPDAAAGYRACTVATDGPAPEGSVGAGTGATVGKLRGPALATKGGIGSASTRLRDGTVVGALVAVNSVGSVVDPTDGRVLAGARRPGGAGFEPLAAYRALGTASVRGWQDPAPGANTTIGVVATDARLDPAGATHLARVAHDGLALSIRPAHTPFDGDTLFALSTARDPGPPGNLAALGVAAVDVVAEAVMRAIRAARGLGGVPSASEPR
jgi:L-aminopeptidase/D-esterase-like protein